MQLTEKRYGNQETSNDATNANQVAPGAPGKRPLTARIQAKSDPDVVQRLASDQAADGPSSARFQGNATFAAVFAGQKTLSYGFADAGVVTILQQALNALGHDVGAADGVWGPATSRGVRAFQAAAGLIADAIVGKNTLTTLDSADNGGGGTGTTTGTGTGTTTGTETGTGTTTGTGTGTTTGTGTGTGTETGTGTGELGGLDAARQRLLEGGFKSLGGFQVNEDKSFGGFENAELQSLLSWYLANWHNVSNPFAPTDDTMGPGAGGHTAGGDNGSHPRWLSGFQNHLMGLSKAAFDDHARAAQSLCRSYLNAWAFSSIGSAGPDSDEAGAVGHSHSGLEEFFNNVGASESNEEATALGGYKDGVNWCAEASNKACIMGLMRRGLRFKSVKPITSQPVQVDINRQAAHIVTTWSKQGGGRVEGCKGDEELRPGDYISIIGQGPVSGHAATVVYADPPTGEGIIKIVSGNAAGVRAGEGAVRVEQVHRERQPAGYNWFKAMEKNNNPSSSYSGPLRPQPGVVWLVSVVRLSQLDANILLQGTEEGSSELLEQHGLERFDLAGTFGKTPQMMKYLKQAFKDL